VNNSTHSELSIQIETVSGPVRVLFAVALILISTTIISLIPVLPLITIS